MPTGPRSRASPWSATPRRSQPTSRWTIPRSTRCPAGQRRWNRRSSSPVPTTWRAGDSERWIVIARWGSYHGNSLGALDLSGRKSLRRPYEAWLGRFRHVSAAYPYRAGEPGSNALGDAEELAAELERAIEAAGPGTVAAFVAEPIVGATLAAAVPPDGYWAAIAEVCRRHGVLLIADEVMTAFGRTGTWFGVDHWGVRPDILVGAKGATSGYFPFGFVAASGAVRDAVLDGPGFVHGFTYSHHVVGAAVAGEVLRILEDERLVEASATKGDRLRALLDERLADHPNVGEIRGRGLLIGLELVADRETHAPFPRADRVTERVLRAARENGLLLYSGHGPRRRNERRRDPARAPVRHHGIRARAPGRHPGCGDRFRDACARGMKRPRRRRRGLDGKDGSGYAGTATRSGEGTIPSWTSMPNWSTTAQCSVIRPLTPRPM